MLWQGQNGASGVCVTDTGEVGGRLVGVVAGRDVDFVGDRRGTHLRDVMTTCAPGSIPGSFRVSVISPKMLRAQYLVAAMREAGRRSMQQCTIASSLEQACRARLHVFS